MRRLGCLLVNVSITLPSRRQLQGFFFLSICVNISPVWIRKKIPLARFAVAQALPLILFSGCMHTTTINGIGTAQPLPLCLPCRLPVGAICAGKAERISAFSAYRRAAFARDFLLEIFCQSIIFISVYLHQRSAGERARPPSDSMSTRVSNATETLFFCLNYII